MANIDSKVVFTVELTQKEFSVMTRSLAGHELKTQDLVLARELNTRLLRLRASQAQDFARQAARALEVAEQEMEAMLGKDLAEKIEGVNN